MIVIRWAATLIFLLCLAVFVSGARGWALVIFAVVMFAIAGWAWGAATHGPWIGEIDDEHPDSLGSLDMLQRYGAHQTTAGGNPSPEDARPPDA